CIRTAAAMGVEAVIAPRDRSATLTPTARKVAAGGADKVKFIQVANLARTLGQIEEDFIVRVVGTMLDEKALPIQNFDFTGTGVCVVMGAEDTGLRPITQSQCHQSVYIPMAGNLQSLNVSVATGMALYEASRQRNHYLLMALSDRTQGYVFLVVTMCIWGGFTLTARLNALWQISAWDIVALRFSLAFLILMPILLYRKEADFLLKKEPFILAMIGGVIYCLFAYSAFHYAPTAHAAIFLNGCIPICTAIMAFFLMGQAFDKH